MAHTPGPWYMREPEIENVVPYRQVTTEINYAIIAEVVGCGSGDVDSNACLIAAAPKLLAACKAAAEALKSAEQKYPDVWTWVEPVLVQITAAIAKAEEAQA